jgi:hypothetical protein
MNDVTIKNRIEAAVGVQKAPEKLVQQTILRVQGVTAGRNAEQRLEQEGSHLPQKEIAYLTAAGLIGRLAFFRPLPEGCSLQQMTEQLASSPKLLQRLNRPVHETLSHLRSGMLFSEIGAQPPHRETLHTKAPKAVEPPAR